MLKIVPTEEIPTEVVSTPTDDLMALYRVCQQMESVCIFKQGIGLAAVQVGLPWKFFIYWSNYPTEPAKFSHMIDCEYEPVTEEKSPSIEGCLSLRKTNDELRHFKLERFRKVRIRGKRLVIGDGLSLEDVDFVEEDNIFAVVCQHEIEHHHGILISDIGEELELYR